MHALPLSLVRFVRPRIWLLFYFLQVFCFLLVNLHAEVGLMLKDLTVATELNDLGSMF